MATDTGWAGGVVLLRRTSGYARDGRGGSPWARIIVSGRGAVPVVERLSDGVESLGAHGIQPTAASLKRQVLVTELRGGDPDGVLARALNDWRARNALIAAHSTVAQHFPPVV
jgi:hypothetical protein